METECTVSGEGGNFSLFYFKGGRPQVDRCPPKPHTDASKVRDPLRAEGKGKGLRNRVQT